MKGVECDHINCLAHEIYNIRADGVLEAHKRFAWCPKVLEDPLINYQCRWLSMKWNGWEQRANTKDQNQGWIPTRQMG